MFSGYTIFSLSVSLLDLSGSETTEKKDLGPGGHTRNEEAMDKTQRYLNKNKQDTCMNTYLHILKILTVVSGTALFDNCINYAIT